jgi:hypothetical protein
MLYHETTPPVSQVGSFKLIYKVMGLVSFAYHFCYQNYGHDPKIQHSAESFRNPFIRILNFSGSEFKITQNYICLHSPGKVLF